MKYSHGQRRRAIEYEKALISYWKENKIFEKSVESRPIDNSYVFYDGPPFITGVPHHGTLLASVIKDAVPRYWTMKGKRVERVWGWDCHGLPAEVFTEKKLGIKDRREIGSKISLEEYIKTCRDNMVQTGNLWEDTIDRIGRWVDFKGAYKTMDKEFMESVWWAFKTLYEKGKIYEGEKVLMYCTRDATPISKAEVAMDNSYQDVTDPSVYVKFKLRDQDKYLLAWTTTPWTLPSNSAIAVNKDLEYQEVVLNGETLIIAKNLVAKALVDEKHQPLDYQLGDVYKGEELVGKAYQPLFDTYSDLGEQAFKVWHAEFVHDEEGTGIAHESPAYGEEDYELSKSTGFPWVMSTDESGIYIDGEWKGRLVWDVNKEIAKTLHERGDVLRIEYIKHSYPHCHRCGTKLMYRAHPSWFMNIQGQRSEMLEQNETINWFPKHLKDGRFAKTVESAPDWNLSRDRFWATPIPVWEGRDGDGNVIRKVVGSYQELKELSGVELEDYHRPWIDDVTFKLDGVEYRRIDKVIDCWFESGSMPFAQFHYPFENVEKFENNFPGDFIAEYIGQVRAWFYYLHAVNVGLFGKSAFKNVITTGTLLGADGRKLSKSLNNFTDPNLLMDEYSADSLRFFMLSSPVLSGEDAVIQDKDVGVIARKLSMIWNMYDFFTMYAEVDGWDWDGDLADPIPHLKNTLDIWIVSRLHQLISTVNGYMQDYDVPNATKPILEFVDDASNWYVRRSRRRFWKSGDDQDKADAYRTLHYVLTTLSMIIAPFTPFLAEELYQKLTGGVSVHLLDWPENRYIDDDVVTVMAFTRNVINEGLSARASTGVKVRQPLSSVTVACAKDAGDTLANEYKEIIKEELNVKNVEIIEADNQRVELDFEITDELLAEGQAREVIRHIQNARKQAGLNVDDRINLSLWTDNETLTSSIQVFEQIIMHETLATKLQLKSAPDDAAEVVKIDGATFAIKLS